MAGFYSLKDSEKRVIVGSTPPMKDIFMTLDKLVKLKNPPRILITGETGVGKELVARALHYNNCRKSKNFVALNCGTLPENLIETELFGYCRGAFTGAYKKSPGLLEAADSGTLFFDEITEMPLIMQAKILRFLNDGEYTPVGEAKPRYSSARVICATNQDLVKAVESGSFRKDLYYRVNVMEIAIPALRERAEDIPQLVGYFISKYTVPGELPKTFSGEAMAKLQQYNWPGNVRELEHCVYQAIVLCPDKIIQPGYISLG
ncbi:MAG: sigma-54 dependent transcriptional regulator [Nanoarchaeota archaeon]|nr:sigma-54 dependent transcriptional regulator [Nanoarchaeota archaeon]